METHRKNVLENELANCSTNAQALGNYAILQRKKDDDLSDNMPKGTQDSIFVSES